MAKKVQAYIGTRLQLVKQILLHLLVALGQHGVNIWNSVRRSMLLPRAWNPACRFLSLSLFTVTVASPSSPRLLQHPSAEESLQAA